MPTDEHDSFNDLTLDERFVKGASNKELSASERARRTRRRHIERAQEKRRKHEARKANRPHRRFGRYLKARKGVIVAVSIMVIAGGVWWSDSGPSKAIAGQDHAGITKLDNFTQRPTPHKAASVTPLGRSAPLPAIAGPYKFIASQPGSAQPVTYDPCRPIDVVVNSRTAPAEGDRLVREAFQRVTAISGLQFNITGTTDEKPSKERAAFQPNRYGDRWAPVLLG